MPEQSDWKWCNKCQALTFAGSPSQGACPAGEEHDHTGSGDYALTQDVSAAGPTKQSNWRWCNKCQTLTFAGSPSVGACAAGGSHNHAGSGDYVLTQDVAVSGAQSDWRWCNKCQALTFAGNPSLGACPAGGNHDHAGSGNYEVSFAPSPPPAELSFSFNPIVFDGGVPVGGWSNLTVRHDGTFTFAGHFHDSGGTEYNMALAWAVKDSRNIVYTFGHTGHVAGTFESGSRDDDWSVDSQNEDIAQNWANIAAANSGQAQANATGDLTNLVNTIVGTLGTVLGVVAIIA